MYAYVGVYVRACVQRTSKVLMDRGRIQLLDAIVYSMNCPTCSTVACTITITAVQLPDDSLITADAVIDSMHCRWMRQQDEDRHVKISEDLMKNAVAHRTFFFQRRCIFFCVSPTEQLTSKNQW